MELKPESLVDSMINQNVLIVPLWNWNFTTTSGNKKDLRVLIVPLWNWNIFVPVLPELFLDSINCTVVELKHCKVANVMFNMQSINCTVVELKLRLLYFRLEILFVLIVPLWNWNMLRSKVNLRMSKCINCTVVELKRVPCPFPTAPPAVLIVPLWNWNFARAGFKPAS